MPHRTAHARLPAHVLGDGHRGGPELWIVSEHLVGEHQVDAGVVVGVIAVKLRVAADEVPMNPPVLVQHRGHAVEPETVELKFFGPVPYVGQQETQRLVLAKVEHAGTPQAVPAHPRVLVEEVTAGPVELVEPVDGVVARVCVHHVHEALHPHAVALVHEVLEVLRTAAPVRGGEEVRNLISERGVVGVVRDGHELHAVIPELLDPRQDLVGELAVRAAPRLLGRHPDVRLVDAKRRGPDSRLLVPPLVPLPLGRIVIDAVVVASRLAALLVAALDDALDPRRDAVELAAVVGLHDDSNLGAVLEPRGGGDVEGPLAELVALALKLPRFPPVEVAHEGQSLGARRVFHVSHVPRRAVGLGMQAVLLVRLRERLQGSVVLLDLLEPALEPLVPAVEQVLVGHQAGFVATEREPAVDGPEADPGDVLLVRLVLRDHLVPAARRVVGRFRRFDGRWRVPHRWPRGPRGVRSHASSLRRGDGLGTSLGLGRVGGGLRGLHLQLGLERGSLRQLLTPRLHFRR